MGVEYCLIVWLIVVIVIFFLARNYNITWWSSLVLALFFGLLVIIAGVHLGYRNDKCDDDSESSCDRHKKDDSKYGFAEVLLALLVLISVVVVVVYIIQRVFDDKCPVENDECGSDEM